MLDETEIQKLLRLKRYEQPPAGYHEKFLQDFQRRQRSEMLRQPLWKLVLERMGSFFSEQPMGRYAYGAATAAVLLFAGVASYNMLNDGGSAPTNFAITTPASPASPVTPATPASFPLQGSLAGHSEPLPELKADQSMRPHYIIDSRPVSYERPFSF